MKLNEWNDLITYGNMLCDTLKQDGYDVRLAPYTVCDGRKGLVMQVYDSFGDVFKEFYSGIDRIKIMKLTMYMNMKRIKTEC